MKAVKLIILLAIIGLFQPLGQTSKADHIRQSLIDDVFYTFEYELCEADTACITDSLNDNEYSSCLKYFLHLDYTQAQLEAILDFKRQYGYISDYEIDFYLDLVEEWIWIGC